MSSEVSLIWSHPPYASLKASTHDPYLRSVCMGQTYGPDVWPVRIRTSRVYWPLVRIV